MAQQFNKTNGQDLLFNNSSSSTSTLTWKDNSDESDIFNSAINFTSDPAFTHLHEILKHIIYAITNNFEIVINHKVDVPRGSTGGKIWNTLSATNAKSLISDLELMKIANAFKATIVKTNLSSYSNKFNDVIKHLAYFTKYCYTPVRLEYTSIPEEKQIHFLKAWLTTVIVLIANENYSNRFTDILPRLDTYKTCIQRLFKDEGVRAGLKALEFSKVDTMLKSKAPASNALHNFIEIFAVLLSNINTEIVLKFCPNFNDCKLVNPVYDGKWLSPFDSDVTEQLKKLRSLK